MPGREVLPDAVLGSRRAEVGGLVLDILLRVSHGDAGAHRPEHRDVVSAVSKGDGLIPGETKVPQNRPNALALAAPLWNDVDRAGSPGGDFGMLCPGENPPVLLLPSVASQSFFELRNTM